MMIKLKWVLLCLLLLNIVACGHVSKHLGGDPTKKYHVTEAYIYPEYRVGSQKAARTERITVAAEPKRSNLRAPASVSR